MKTMILAVLLTATSLAWGVDTNGKGQSPYKHVAEIRGSTLRWLFLVEGEIRSRKIDLDRYEVSVSESDEIGIVVLRVAGQPEGQRGHSGGAPGLEIEVNKADGRVLRSYYIR